MIQKFDYFNTAERPPIILCNPNTDRLYSMADIKDIKVTLNYNALSEISFECPAQINGVSIPYYPLITYRRLVYIENIGYFLINDVKTVNEGGVKEYKQVTAKDWSVDFNYKRISLFTGTYKFYDFVDPGPTLLGTILSYMPGWNVGTVSTSLLALSRTFDVSDNSIYNFLQTDVENAYQCVFSYDFTNKTISAYTTGEATQLTDIYLSFNNLVKKTDIAEISDSLITALACYGGEGLDISFVNPMGTPTIYNLDYFTNIGFMTQDLIDSVTIWKNKIAANQIPYANYLSQYESANAVLITQTSDLVNLKAYMDDLVGIQNARIRGRIPYGDINSQIAAQQGLINNKNNDITASNVTLAGIQANLVAINTDLSFDTNFTASQQIQLSPFIIGNTYNNTGFIITDQMDAVGVQVQAQGLYDQAKTVLTKISQPKYTFDIEAANFLNMQEFQTFITQLNLGSIINFEMSSGSVVYPIVLSMQFQYDDPTQFKMTFGNRLRLDNASFIYSDIFGDSLKSGTSTQFNSESWSNFSRNWKDPVSVYMSSALNAALNTVISNSNQEVLINKNGISCRLDSGSGNYDPNQMRIVNNMIAFTKDNWNTASLALGQISTNSGSAFGLIADVVVGNLIAGNQLLITNSNNSFIVDANGATLSNAKLTINTNNSMNVITLDPDRGIAIQQKTAGSTIKDLFYVDMNGNLIINGSGTFGGTLTSPLGDIGGWHITPNGLSDDYGNHINSNQDIVLGKLTMLGSTMTFDGNIYARNLQDQIKTDMIADFAVTNAKIANLNAGKITAGTMLADRIWGGTIRWGGSYNDPMIQMGMSGTGKAQILSKEGIDISTNGVLGPAISMSPLLANGEGGMIITGGAFHAPVHLGLPGDQIYVDAASLWVYDPADHVESREFMKDGDLVVGMRTVGAERMGKTGNIMVGAGAPVQTLRFVKGILVDAKFSNYTFGVYPPTSTGGTTSGNPLVPNNDILIPGWRLRWINETPVSWNPEGDFSTWYPAGQPANDWSLAGGLLCNATYISRCWMSWNPGVFSAHEGPVYAGDSAWGYQSESYMSSYGGYSKPVTNTPPSTGGYANDLLFALGLSNYIYYQVSTTTNVGRWTTSHNDSPGVAPWLNSPKYSLWIQPN